MNTVIMMGRLTRDPVVRYTNGDSAVANYSIAVDRRFKREGQADADFFNLVSFGKQAEFVEKYLKKGTKIVIQGRLQNANYEKDGQTIYRDQIITESVEFAESKAAAEQSQGGSGKASGSGSSRKQPETDENGFMNIPDGIDEELPFN